MILVVAPPPVSGLNQQRMVKSGTFSQGSTSWVTVSGWTSDTTRPAVVSAHQLQVVGSGVVTVTAVLDCQTDDMEVPNGIRIARNGTALASGTLGAYNDRRTITLTAADVPVDEGDLIAVQTNTGYFSVYAKVYAGSYVDIT